MSSSAVPPEKRGPGLRWNPWNLFLLVPLLVLITPLYNHAEPTLFGMPFFYWFQFVVILVGVVCTVIVYFKSKDEPVIAAKSDQLDVDDLDEGSTR